MDERLERLAEDDPKPRLHLEAAALGGLRKSINQARVRCADVEDLISRLPEILDDPGYFDVLARLSEIELTERQLVQVADTARLFARLAGQVPGRERARVDRALSRIIKLLPTIMIEDLLIPLLADHRRPRREMAYKALKRAGVSPGIVPNVLDAFECTGDEVCLELIVRSGSLLPKVDVGFLLENLSEDYWRARIFESLFRHEPSKAIGFGNMYPHEFIWGLGRAKAWEHLHRAWRLVQKEGRNVAVLSIFAWAIGQSGSGDELAKFERHVADIFPRNSEQIP